MVVLVAAVVTTAFSAGMGASLVLARGQTQPAAVAPTNESASVEQTFEVFWQAWSIIQKEFYGQVPDAIKMTNAAIRGVVDSLGDENTAFVDAQRAKMLNDDLSGSFEGIGATVRMEDGHLLIVQPLSGRPAEKAGLLAGDIILKVNDTVIENMSLIEAISLIRGPQGTKVRLTILRAGIKDPFEVEIVRARIEMQVVESRMVGDKKDIAYLRLVEFNSQATRRTREALRELLQQNPRGLIFDLRGNPGGFLQTSIEIASEFISDGVILSEVDKNGEHTRHLAQRGGLATKIPLVVLINAGSASASEIVAGAIQDHRRGILIGETTLGKGSVQVAHTLSDGSSLRVTIRHWLTPNGRKIDKQGIKPDIEVKSSAEDQRLGRDAPLLRAIEYLTSGK